MASTYTYSRDDGSRVVFEGRCQSKADGCGESLRSDCESKNQAHCAGEGTCVVGDRHDGDGDTCCYRLECPVQSVAPDHCHEKNEGEASCEGNFGDNCIQKKMDR